MPTRTTRRLPLVVAAVAACVLLVGLAASSRSERSTGDHDAGWQAAARVVPDRDDDTPARVTDRPDARHVLLNVVLVAATPAAGAALRRRATRLRASAPIPEPARGFGAVGRRAPPIVHSI